MRFASCRSCLVQIGWARRALCAYKFMNKNYFVNDKLINLRLLCDMLLSCLVQNGWARRALCAYKFMNKNYFVNDKLINLRLLCDLLLSCLVQNGWARRALCAYKFMNKTYFVNDKLINLRLLCDLLLVEAVLCKLGERESSLRLQIYEQELFCERQTCARLRALTFPFVTLLSFFEKMAPLQNFETGVFPRCEKIIICELIQHFHAHSRWYSRIICNSHALRSCLVFLWPESEKLS